MAQEICGKAGETVGEEARVAARVVGGTYTIFLERLQFEQIGNIPATWPKRT